MINGNRISVLSNYLDGEYYGSIYFTLLQEARKRNSTLFAIQTIAIDQNSTSFNYQVGTSVTDGWILMLNTFSHEFLKALESTGKPIVTVGYREDTIKCNSVTIDNRSGTKEAVLHLIKEHGHKRIAFVGCMDQFDIRERFEGYKDALQECDIPYEDGLLFLAVDQMREGGALAAKDMLARGIDFTAIVASTDHNALTLIETLQEAGYRFPEDIAIIGFDDMDISEAFDPPLTTVRQSFSDLALLSSEVLFRRMSGEEIQDVITYTQPKLIIRKSCGCDYAPKVMTTKELQKPLVQMAANMDKITNQHYQLVASWVSATREENIDFSNMYWKNSHWGCLALWDKNEEERRHLIIKQAFSMNGDPIPAIDLKIPIEEFIPTEWIPSLGAKDFVRVQSIRNEKDDWGFIVLVGPMDELDLMAASDINRLSFTIFAAALERDDLFNQISFIAERLEIVSRTTNDGIWDWNLTNNQIQWSTRIHDMLSSIDETITNDPKSFIQLIHTEDYKRVRHAFKNHIEKGMPLQVEFRILGKNKEHLWVYAAGDTIRNQHGIALRIIGSITNITEKKRAEEQIRHLAFHDGLTRLPNRELLLERLKLCMAQANRFNHKLGVLMIDLDRFKIINDTLGHQAGDLLLQQVAIMLVNTLRSTDTISRGGYEDVTVARLGGDEFIVLLTHIQDVTEIQLVANRLIQMFKEPFMIQNIEIFTSASIGISVYPEDGMNSDVLIRCADIAMYKAKENGKNQMRMYSSDIYSLTIERFKMENQLRKALERNEFLLHYQPQINLENGQILGVEALIRWNSLERGMVSPMEFIPLAEETGLIIPIGHWVLKEACRQNKYWIDQGLTPIVVSVNISARQLQQSNFKEMVQQILEETNLSPSLLCLEITESTAIKNVELSTNMLEELGEIGIQIAIDDFGTGYSSLAMLKQLPITNVKIDKSFIDDMGIDQDDTAIVKAIIAMAHSLDLTVTAEGVETEEQKNILINERCNYIQGYYFSKPLKPEECLSYIQNIASSEIPE